MRLRGGREDGPGCANIESISPSLPRHLNDVNHQNTPTPGGRTHTTSVNEFTVPRFATRHQTTKTNATHGQGTDEEDDTLVVHGGLCTAGDLGNVERVLRGGGARCGGGGAVGKGEVHRI